MQRPLDEGQVSEAVYRGVSLALTSSQIDKNIGLEVADATLFIRAEIASQTRRQTRYLSACLVACFGALCIIAWRVW